MISIHLLSKSDWPNLLESAEALMAQIDRREVFVVRQFMPLEIVEDFKAMCLTFAAAHKASWHPCLDGCPDYHRIHNNYPKAHVPSIQHAYYFHSWNEIFPDLMAFDGFREIFWLKRKSGGLTNNDFLRNHPSEGPIARLVCHQYPRGGGAQAEHIDPVSSFAKIQTIIQLSNPGVDYCSGGLYMNDSQLGVFDIDKLTQKGDLILMSPGVRHGVAPIDSHKTLNWNSIDGRWIVMPIIIDSDHVIDPYVRPQKMGVL